LTATKTFHKEYSIRSKRELIPKVVQEIMAYLEQNTPINGCECRFDIKVVLNELISNAAFHGNCGDESKPVDIKVAYDGRSLEFLIVDRGCEFTPDDIEEEKLLCENNRGISICHILCKKLKYKFIEGVGNSAKAVFILKSEKEDMNMTKLRELYYCKHCNNLVEVVAEGATALVCCGEDMELLSAKTADQGKEKHVPVVSEKDGGVLVKVGDVPHPMTDAHWINFIEICTADTVTRKELTAEDAPEAWFNVAPADVVCVRSYCNLHGLWSA
jgi:superoxide reductase